MAKPMKIEVGEIFGNLKYIKDAPIQYLPSGQKPRRILCECVLCGNITNALLLHVVRGRITSCGCNRGRDRENEIGNKYGTLTVISDCNDIKFGDRPVRAVLAICECGKTKEYALQVLKQLKSCGCKTADILRENVTTHGLAGSRIYGIWQNMKNRCYNSDIPSYAGYGAKGISVCPEWRNSFEVFYEWSIRNGYQEHLTIDRFPNKNGNYEPSNCRWATYEQQANNKDNNIIIEYKGDNMTLPMLCRKYGVSYTMVEARVNELGWDLIKAMETPKIEKEESIRIMLEKSPRNKKGFKVSEYRHKLELVKRKLK